MGPAPLDLKLCVVLSGVSVLTLPSEKVWGEDSHSGALVFFQILPPLPRPFNAKMRSKGNVEGASLWEDPTPTVGGGWRRTCVLEGRVQASPSERGSPDPAVK